MSALIGVKTVESLDAVKSVLKEYCKPGSYWFLKWPHDVSGFIEKSLDDINLSPEGQLIHPDYEIRWKPEHGHYSLLLLAVENITESFIALDGEWKTKEVPGMVYQPPIPKFSKVRRSPIQVRQRYFIDARTETIHFVALSPEKANAK